MARALSAAVAIAGLAGCAALFGLFGSARRPASGPGLGHRVEGPNGSHHRVAIDGGGALTDGTHASYFGYGMSVVSARESTVAMPVPASGTLTDLNVIVSSAPGTGAVWRLTIDKDESATALSCSIRGLDTTCADSSPLAMRAGALLDLAVTPFGTPRHARITWSATITP